MWNDIQWYFASRVAYDNGRSEKGNGKGSVVGYYMDMITSYLDLLTEMTHMYNKCQLDYIMQAWGPIFTSLPGALGFLMSFLSVLIEDTETANYTAMSAAAYNKDVGKAGETFGIFFMRLYGIEL